MSNGDARHAAAHALDGRQLDGGWRVIEKVVRSKGASGSRFSTGYVVQRQDGQRGFLKALDYSAAFQPGLDTPAILQSMTNAYTYERDLVATCSDLSKVVRFLGSGSTGESFDRVDYLIFELADGDVRSRAHPSVGLDAVWALRTLHNAAVGLRQLHSKRIAHQDVKPSNILVFDATRSSKLGDLGRASSRTVAADHDEFDVPGDRAYAPPEQLYGHIEPDWSRRRLGSDLYQLGSLIVFMFCEIGMTPLLRAHLAEAHWHEHWTGSYPDVLPYLQAAAAEALDVIGESLDPALLELTEIVGQLCNPDVSRRGHPLDHRPNGNPWSLERHITKLDVLAKKAEYKIRKSQR